MTNYMGKERLIKLFYQYISDRNEYIKNFKSAVKEYGKDVMFEYKKHKGSEWLHTHHDGYNFDFYVFGNKNKIIDLTETVYNCESDEEELLNKVRVISYYTEDFYPYPNNKSSLLNCYSIEKRPRYVRK